MKALHFSKGSGRLWPRALQHPAKKLSLVVLMVISFGCKKAAETVLDGPGTMEKTGTNAADEYFYMAVLPDTQYYTDPGGSHAGAMQSFINQIDWIVDNKTALEIKYVAHLGDITDNGDRPGHGYEWVNAKNQLYRLDAASIPYGLAVGNHDQWCFGNAGEGGTNNGFGAYFGKDHFNGYSWYGDPYGSSNNNDNHYDLFTEDGIKYLVMYIEFNQSGYKTGDPVDDCDNIVRYSSTIETNVTNWANGIIQANADRKVIIVSHSILNPHKTGDPVHDNKHRDLVGQGPDNLPGTFTAQGDSIYKKIARPNTNVFMMLGGHITGEGYLVKNENGHVVKAFVSDFQDRPYGGNGYMRILKFNKTTGKIDIRTIRPLPGTNGEELDADSKFTVNMFN